MPKGEPLQVVVLPQVPSVLMGRVVGGDGAGEEVVVFEEVVVVVMALMDEEVPVVPVQVPNADWQPIPQ